VSHKKPFCRNKLIGQLDRGIPIDLPLHGEGVSASQKAGVMASTLVILAWKAARGDEETRNGVSPFHVD
jgi:hypothetical protein